MMDEQTKDKTIEATTGYAIGLKADTKLLNSELYRNVGLHAMLVMMSFNQISREVKMLTINDEELEISLTKMIFNVKMH